MYHQSNATNEAMSRRRGQMVSDDIQEADGPKRHVLTGEATTEIGRATKHDGNLISL